jgi:uncharacterized membrane protein
MTVIETHSRTLLKTIAYRILCTIAIYFIALSLGATSAASGTMAITIFFLGIVLYYLHDRVWNRFNWNRNEDGKESARRSLAKTILYRLITVVIAIVVAKLIMTDSNQTAVAFAVSQFVVNMILYYLVERVFNRFNIGRVVVNGV